MKWPCGRSDGTELGPWRSRRSHRAATSNWDTHRVDIRASFVDTKTARLVPASEACSDATTGVAARTAQSSDIGVGRVAVRRRRRSDASVHGTRQVIGSRWSGQEGPSPSLRMTKSVPIAPNDEDDEERPHHSNDEDDEERPPACLLIAGTIGQPAGVCSMCSMATSRRVRMCWSSRA